MNRMMVQPSHCILQQMQQRTIEKTLTGAGLGKEKYPAPGFRETHAANVQKLPENAAKKHPLRSIRAQDYKKLDIPGTEDPVFCIPQKKTWFVEKFTKEQQAMEKGQRDARRLCRSCHAAAVKAEQEASISPARGHSISLI